jgi:hypothetical protein
MTHPKLLVMMVREAHTILGALSHDSILIGVGRSGMQKVKTTKFYKYK